MKAVNLIPPDARKSRVGPSVGKLGAAHYVLGLLVIAVAMVTALVLTNNSVSQRKAQLATTQQEVSHVQAQVTRLQRYEQFEKLEQARAQTVQQLAAQRFDWSAALGDLSRVVPANTVFKSLVATASATTASGGSAGGSSGGGGGGSVRGDIDAPAFQLTGCTSSQDEVARLMSRLRVMNGVTRVTLEDSTAQAGGSGTGSGTTTSQGGCPAQGPSFDMTVFFQPLTSAGSTTGQTVSTTTGAAK